MNELIGEDPSYAPDFLELAAAVEDRTIQGGQPTDWLAVAREAERLLDRCKDVRAMTWLALARARTRGWGGAREGLEDYLAFVERFWDRAYPAARGRTRANFVALLWAGLGRALADVEGSRDEIARAADLANALDARLGDRLGGQNPGHREFRLFLTGRLETLPADPEVPSLALATPLAVEAPVATPAPVTAAAPPMQPRSTPPTPVGDLASVRDALRTLAREARAHDLAQPHPYRWARTAAWIAIDDLPEVDLGRTRLRAPSPDEREELEALSARGEWKELVQAAEGALERSIWWLDLHRFSAQALSRLGGTHAVAAQTVLAELRAFIARLPTVETLSFSDGTPFASTETCALLAADRASLACAEARSEVSSSNEAASVEDLVTGAIAMPVGRRRFAMLVGAATRATSEGKLQVARALCEALLVEVSPALEAWEPRLCGELFATYLRALDGAEVPLRQALFRRLLTTDPTQALRI